MKTKEKVTQIILECVPVVLMVMLIPFVIHDYFLTFIYSVIIAVAFIFKHEHHDHIFFIFGLVIMFIAEYFFISMGVETFNRNSLFGIMPLWLPVLWAYGFVAIKRAILIIHK